MTGGIFHEGSGLGDQLFRYITVRSIARERDWGMYNSHNFKGSDFMNLDFGKPLDVEEMIVWNEKDIRDALGNDIRSYDPEVNFVENNTIIDGSFEDDKYWRHNLKNINKWLAVEPLEVPDDKCVIGFRGGEYASIPELFLPKEYYEATMESMPGKKFEVHTDDPVLAKQFFPDLEIIDNTRLSHSKHSNMGFNWRSMRHAKYAVIPNSAFFILPRILKHHEDKDAVTIAPRYWAGRNVGIWKRPACYYPEFSYL